MTPLYLEMKGYRFALICVSERNDVLNLAGFEILLLGL